MTEIFLHGLNVVAALDRGNGESMTQIVEACGRCADVSDEVKERIALLRRSYLENVKATSHMQKRIMKAFPKMQSRNYKESFEDLRNKLKEMSLKK